MPLICQKWLKECYYFSSSKIYELNMHHYENNNKPDCIFSSIIKDTARGTGIYLYRKKKPTKTEVQQITTVRSLMTGKNCRRALTNILLVSSEKQEKYQLGVSDSAFVKASHL